MEPGDSTEGGELNPSFKVNQIALGYQRFKQTGMHMTKQDGSTSHL